MCHMSHVLCIVPMPLFNHSQTLRARDLQFLHDIHHTLVAMCLVSHVRCHMSLVMCHMSLVTYHMSCDSILILIFSYTLWELVGEGSVFNGASPFLVFRAFIIKNAMIPIFFNFQGCSGPLWVIKKSKFMKIKFKNGKKWKFFARADAALVHIFKKNILESIFFSKLCLGTFSWFSWDLFHG